MGCLNSSGQFQHWFGNIHLSGPCNRSCYFCIGQHMMALDGFNVLDTWPLPGWDEFVERCRSRQVQEVYLTGTNTDPMLYRYRADLQCAVRRDLGAKIGVRTNAVANVDQLAWFDMGSVTICSLDPAIYRAMMGSGNPPNLDTIMAATARWNPTLKVNVVLGPENVPDDLWHTLDGLRRAGVQRVNLREPYGQPHVGDPCAGVFEREGTRFGMPLYSCGGMDVLYWDVHYVEVESVNLYASGRVSETYPITKGHADTGVVEDQTHFPGGRVRDQWVTTDKPSDTR